MPTTDPRARPPARGGQKARSVGASRVGMRGWACLLGLTILVQVSCGSSREEDPPSGVATWSTEGVSPGPVVVSLTFDDSVADQYAARAALAARGMHATFYINSPRIGTIGYLTQQQVLDLFRDGNELGSHTLGHPHLRLLSASEQKRELCNDRVALEGLLCAAGVAASITSVAYPRGESDSVTQAAARACGFNSARGVGGLCDTCSTDAAETMPPRDPMLVRGYGSIRSTTPLRTLTDRITHAHLTGGGWVPLIFHHICTSCSEYAITEPDFHALLDWIQGHAHALGLQVKTVDEVIGGSPQPLVFGPVANDSLEDDVAPADGLADCWQRVEEGDNAGTAARGADARTGQWAEVTTITRHTGGSRRLVTNQDGGLCAPPARPGHSYSVSGWYKGTGQVRVVTYYRDTSGAWHPWASGAALCATSTWREASFTTPPAPTDARALSFGLSLESAGSITVDDFAVRER